MFKKKQEEESFKLDLTSMIDVIFLLLIFFMCATQIKKDEKALPLQSSGGSSPTPKFQIQIKITNDNQNPENVMVNVNNNDILLKNLPSKLRALKNVSNDPNVSILAKPQIKFDNIMRILDSCAYEKLDRISMRKLK